MTNYICKCGGVGHFESRPIRIGVSERLACDSCGRATPWRSSPHGEHRAELVGLWTVVQAKTGNEQ